MEKYYRITKDFPSQWKDNRCSTGFRAIENFKAGWLILVHNEEFNRYVKVITQRGSHYVEGAMRSSFICEASKNWTESEPQNAHEKIVELGISDYNLDSLIQSMIDCEIIQLEDIEKAYRALEKKWESEE